MTPCFRCPRAAPITPAWTSPLLTPTRKRGEAQQHQQVPLPPGGAPVSRPDDHEHRFGEQRERERHPEEDERTATQVEAQVADGRRRVEDDARGGERHLRAVELLRRERRVQGPYVGDRPRG